MTNQQAITILKNLEQSLDGYCELNEEGKTAFRIAITALELFGISEQLPSAQPEIIRCKDCKHLQKWRSEESAKKFGHIYECGKGVLRDPVPDDFCSKAERKTNVFGSD